MLLGSSCNSVETKAELQVVSRFTFSLLKGPVGFIFQGSVAGMAQQSDRTSSGLWSPGDPGLLQSRPQRDQDMRDCGGGGCSLDYSPPTFSFF